jgi:hypothetical protein|tara:strand:- start:1833 stop:2111 length:279 start_codon:yes stop_codon:yes gene_type:complete
MEWWQFVIAFWFGGVILAMWKIWRPALLILSRVDPENPMSKNPITATLVILLIFTLFLPFMAIVILFDDKAAVFTTSFLKGAMDKDDNNTQL